MHIWEYLLNDFEDTFRTFKKHINLIREKKIITHAELLELFKQYWMNFYTKDQSKDELPKLAFSRLYSMSNELYGTLHDVFGMHEVYEIIKDLSRLPDAFEKALREKGKNL